MTVDEIKHAVDNGVDVYWSNRNYSVVKDTIGQYLIKCFSNDSRIGLTWTDGKTLNGEEKDFYTANGE